MCHLQLFTGDGYGPGAPAKAEDGRERKGEDGKDGGKGGKKQSEYKAAADKEFRKKESKTCKDYNMSECRYGDSCKYKHACSARLAPTKICWGPHKRPECREPKVGLGK